MIPRSKWGDGTFMIHEHGMVIIWTILCDSLIFVGKYLKKYKRWFDIHAWIFLTLGLLSLFFTQYAPKNIKKLIAMADLSPYEVDFIEGWAKKKLHKNMGGLGNLITLSMIVQGVLMRFMIALEKK